MKNYCNNNNYSTRVNTSNTSNCTSNDNPLHFRNFRSPKIFNNKRDDFDKSSQLKLDLDINDENEIESIQESVTRTRIPYYYYNYYYY